MIDDKNENSKSKRGSIGWTDILSKAGEYGLVFVGLCYAAGFIITNLHLTTIGVVNLDLLRVRYISTGLLFLVFFVAATLPLLLAIYIYQRLKENSPIRRAFAILLVSFVTGTVLLLSLPSIITLPDFPRSYKFGASHGFMNFNRDWTDSIMGSLLASTFLILGFIAASLLLGRNSRESGRSRLLTMLGFTVPIPVYWATSDIVRAFARADTPGWAWFFALAFSLYLVFIGALPALDLSLRMLLSSPTKFPHISTQSVRYMRYLIFLQAWVPIFALLYYLLNMYPDIPQQIGGGGALPIHVMTSNDNLKSLLSSPATSIYLVDRTASDSLLYIANKNPASSKYVTVANAEMDAIVFDPTSSSPSITETAGVVATPTASTTPVFTTTPTATVVNLPTIRAAPIITTSPR